MKVLILGATGGTGRLLVHEAAAEGHHVVALVRSKENAGSLDAELVQGDATDGEAMRRALAGCDAVISSLGTSMSPFKEVTLLSTATRVLVDAMTELHVRRLVCITGLGAGDSRGHGGFLFDNLIMPLLLRKVYEDKNRQEAIIRASALDWVLVRPMILDNKPAGGKLRAVTDLSVVHGGRIARADVAKFVVGQLTDDRWLHKTPLISA